MAEILPPYLGKNVKACEAELKKATREERKLQKKHELAVAYREFCENELKDAKSKYEQSKN